MIKTAIVGATGYTGSELIRILLQHPEAEITAITSNSKAGERFSAIHPQFESHCDLELIHADDLDTGEIDVCFLALPHRISMEFVSKWESENFRIIDLSGDYRLSSADVYEEWYEKKHLTPALVPDVPYGLPEINRASIKGAKIVANPGCYPTASILGLAPLAAADLLENNSVVVDAKSGLTGAGVKSKPTTHFSNVNDNFKSYGLKTHRHTIEIEEAIQNLGSSASMVQFTPHLLPVDRGIQATIYATPKSPVSEEQLRNIYAEFYKDEPFIRLRSGIPELKHVRGTNLCDIHVTYDSRTNRIIVISVIDNLVKGASGAAVQNMNILCSLNEETGLRIEPLKP